MAFGSFNSNSSKGSGTVSEINMVPLIDVMLVLLVIFMITAPLLAHSIKIDVPKVNSQPVAENPKAVDVAVDEKGTIFVDGTAMELENLKEFFINTAKLNPEADIRIRADANARYEIIAQIMAAAKGSGVKRLGFITAPAPVPPTAPAPVPPTTPTKNP